MGLYNNIVTGRLTCPRCGVITGPLCAESKIGWNQLFTYAVGDQIRWAKRKSQGTKRPEGGDGTFVGYADCLACDKDFWLTIEVRTGRITADWALADRTYWASGERERRRRRKRAWRRVSGE